SCRSRSCGRCSRRTRRGRTRSSRSCGSSRGSRHRREPPRVAAKVFNRLPALARFLLVATAVNFAVFAAFRLGFWAAFHEAFAEAPWADLVKALYLGFKFDLRLALLLLLPLALVGWIPLFDPARRSAARTAWLGYLAMAQFAVLLAYFVDFGHYAYVRLRLNASLVDHLTPVSVAARVAWETYPLLPGVLALV